MHQIKEKRRTGRTTRLVQHALKLATEHNRAVYIVGATRADCRYIKNLLDLHAPPDTSHGIVVVAPGDVPELNWETMKLWRAPLSCVVLVDHYAIEHRYKSMLQMLHMFDLPGDYDEVSERAAVPDTPSGSRSADDSESPQR